MKDWLCHAPPAKRAAHWKDGRSAKELARAWIGDGIPTVPEEIKALLESRDQMKEFQPIVAISELVTRLDDFRGGHRNHDLVILGDARGGRTLLAIEGKADESFGQRIDRCLAVSDARRGSNLAHRIEQLCAAVLGRSPRDPDAGLADIRYQLLHAVAGTLIEARRRWAEQSAFIVFEFLSPPDPARGSAGTRPDLVARNAQDLSRFLKAIGAAPAQRLQTPQLAGPILVPGGGLVPTGIPLFVGKATRVLASGSARVR